MLSPTIGDWKSELILLCDDEYKIGKTIDTEKQHTIESSNIYNSLKKYMNIKSMYGAMYARQPLLDWYSQPELTQELLQNINKGVFSVHDSTLNFLLAEN